MFVLYALLGILVFGVWARRRELGRMRAALATRAQYADAPVDAVLVQPEIDLDKCLGCGTCVSACPENGVLELVHGQAQVVRGSRCVGHAVCEAECPVGAIAVTVANLEQRRDVPVLHELEAVGTPGLFLAGEVTAHALIANAVAQGVAVAQAVAARGAGVRRPLAAAGAGGALGVVGDDEPFDICVVGAGPAGLACALEAKRLGLSCVVLDQEPSVGGTVAKYPRAKLVLTQPLELPLVGKLRGTTFQKEELVTLWEQVVDRFDLDVRSGTVVDGVTPIGEDGEGFVVATAGGASVQASNLCMAVGRRGVPRRLGVPGESLPKVAYSLLDAHGYRDRRILVVGGGDSAVEAALALGEQPGNEVVLSYRRKQLFRLKERNAERLRDAERGGHLQILLGTEVRAIDTGSVMLVGDGGQEWTVPNDDVFAMVGGQPPLALLESAGVSFDPADRPQGAAAGDAGAAALEGPNSGGLDPSFLRALWASLALTIAVVAFILWHWDYYGRGDAERAIHASHLTLRSGFGVGLWFGVGALTCIGINLLYLARRRGLLPGSLRVWMSSHVATGILAVLLALLHSALSPQTTPAGHGFWLLVLLLVTGAIGRWFYAWVPRAANGSEDDSAKAADALAVMAGTWADEWGLDLQWGEWREQLERQQWGTGFVGRLRGLGSDRRLVRRRLDRLAHVARQRGVPAEERAQLMALARHAHFSAIKTARLEDLRALLATWRYFHRWGAALMVLLVVVHVVQVLGHGVFSFTW